tara:strand:- start:763 stop:1806 length:1044 start_codon:yes stop_codon:yes gene_type:complete
MDKKEIKINPSFLNYSSKSKSSSKAKTQKAEKTKKELYKVNNESVKALLLQRLKEHRKAKTKKNEVRHEQTKNISSKFMEKLKRRKNKYENNVMSDKLIYNESSTQSPIPFSQDKSKSNSFNQQSSYDNSLINNDTQQVTKIDTPLEQNIIDLNSDNYFNEETPQINHTLSTSQSLPSSISTYHEEKQKTPMESPKYSNLKNSSKPTYREYKTQSLKGHHTSNIQNISHLSEQDNTTNKKRKKEKLEIAVKKIFKVGKNKTQKKVGIFIKNNALKRENENKKLEFKKTNYKTVKNYLKKNNLIKYGTKAPTELLRHMYENSCIVGGVKNINGENMVHNFMEENDLNT